MARQPLLSFQPGSKLHLWLPGARTSPPPMGTHKSFSEVSSATSFTGENDRKGLSIPSLSGRPAWPLFAAGSRPINYSVWPELFESTEVLTSIFIDPCLLTTSQRDRASFLHILDIGSSTWSQKMWTQAQPAPRTELCDPRQVLQHLWFVALLLYSQEGLSTPGCRVSMGKHL